MMLKCIDESIITCYTVLSRQNESRCYKTAVYFESQMRFLHFFCILMHKLCDSTKEQQYENRGRTKVFLQVLLLCLHVQCFKRHVTYTFKVNTFCQFYIPLSTDLCLFSMCLATKARTPGDTCCSMLWRPGHIQAKA